MKLLLCDDSKAVHNMMKIMLEDTGHSVTSFYNAIDLILHIESAIEFDKILLDWEMPTLCGLSALKFMRSSGIASPIIMLTGKNSESHIEEAMACGANSYIIKPFTKDLVLTNLNS